MGGDDGEMISNEVFLLAWDSVSKQVVRTEYPPLPSPCAYGQATLANNVIYLAGGQAGKTLDTALENFWAFDLDKKVWETLSAWPGSSRAFNLTATQHNGYDTCVYVMEWSSARG